MQFRQALSTGFLLADQYRIDAVLGQGGFGITYMAEDVGLRSTVVIKEYFPGQLAVREATTLVHPRSSREAEIYEFGRDRFLQEARILAVCEHPNIVGVRRVIEANNTAYMALNFVRGLSLEQWLTQLKRRPTQAELDAIARPILSAMDYIHGLGEPIIHRDISPDNIMMRDGTVPMLIDFGAARVDTAGRTESKAGAYKIGYSPPEQQAQRSDWQGPWTDIYSFAATLRRAVAGRTPTDCLERQIDDTMPSAVEIGRGHYREEFLAAIDWAMTLRHQDRPRSIHQWRSRLLADNPAALQDKPLQLVGNAGSTGPQKVEARNGLAANWIKWTAAAVVVGAGLFWGAYLLGHRIGIGGAASVSERETLRRQELTEQVNRERAARLRAEAEVQRRAEQATADRRQLELRQKAEADADVRKKFDAEARARADAVAAAARRAKEAEQPPALVPPLPAAQYSYVWDTRPPDAWLALRTLPSSSAGNQIVTMPNGTLIDVLDRRADNWWYVRIVQTGQVGWALSRQGNRVWIYCCRSR